MVVCGCVWGCVWWGVGVQSNLPNIITSGAYPGGLWGRGPPPVTKGAPKIRKRKGKKREERKKEKKKEKKKGGDKRRKDKNGKSI